MLDAEIEVFRLCVRINRLRYQIVRDCRMTSMPKLQGLAKAMKMLESDLEDGAGKLMAKVEAVGSRGIAALAKGHQKVDAHAGVVGEIESFVTALEGSNGGDPLDGSSDTSGQSQPEKLTVNGVSVP
jgi:hypothetical protein